MNFSIEKRIAYLRKSNNLSQKELGEEIYLTQSTVAKCESGISLCKSTLQEIAEKFEIPWSYFTPTEKDPEIDSILDMAFGKLLNINIESLAEVFDKEPYELEISQEVAFRLLQTVYYYKSNQLEKGDQLSENFIPLFIENAEQIKDNATLLKYYYLYNYGLNFKNNALEECYNYCKLLSEMLTDNHQKGRCMVLMCQTLFRRKFINEAWSLTNKTIEFIETFDKGVLLAGAYVTLSSILATLKLYDEALEVLQKLENINESNNNLDALAVLFQHRGIIFSRKKEYQKAVEIHEMAYSNAKYPHNQVKILISLISCHLKTKNILEATKYLNIMNKQDLRNHEKMILMSLKCEISLYSDDVKTHKMLLKPVLKYFEENNYLADLKHIYSYLANYYHEKNLYKQASTYFIKKERLENE